MQPNWYGHIQSKHSSIQFLLMQAYLAYNCLGWQWSVEAGVAPHTPLVKEGWATTISMIMISLGISEKLSKSFSVWTKSEWREITLEVVISI